MPKTKRSRKPIYVPTSLYQDLLSLRQTASDPSPTGWIFPAHHPRRRRTADGSLEKCAKLYPLDFHNWVNRTLKPAGAKLGIKINLRMLRRSFATYAHDSGADPKAIQEQLRHSRISTTMDIYTQPVPASVRLAVEELDRRMRERPQDPDREPPTTPIN